MYNEEPEAKYKVKWDYLSREELYSRQEDATVHIDHKLAACDNPMYKVTEQFPI